MTRFKSGVSGNPKGRPKGVIDKRQKLRIALEERAEELLDVVINRAMQGDAQMQRILLGRLIPPAKPESLAQSFNLPDGNFTKQAQAIIKATSKGEINPSVASELLSAITSSIKIKESEELEQRIQLIEERVFESEK